jgi:hypothetical protein
MIDGQTLWRYRGSRSYHRARTKLPASDRKSIEEIFGKTKGLKQQQREKALRALQEDGSRGVRAKLARQAVLLLIVAMICRGLLPGFNDAISP